MTTLAGSTPIAFVAAEERPLTANCGPTKLAVDLPTWPPPAAVWTFRMLLTTLRMVIRTIVLCIFCATWIPRGEILLNAADIDRDATPAVNVVSNNEVSDSIVDDVNADDEEDDESSVEPTTAGGLVTAIANDSNTSDSDRVWRIDAVPRLFGSASEWPDCRLAREGVNVQWKGVLLVAQAGSYVFTTRHNSLDQLTISLNGKAIRLGHPFELEAGESELVIDAQQRQPPFAFELWWRGPGFADEPVDARFFGHHDRHRSTVESLLTLHQSIERGAVLAEAFGCRQCHSIDVGWYRTDQIDMDSELSGPRLDDVGHRLRPERIRKYHSPQSFLGTVQDPVSRTNHTDASRAVISDYLIESSNDKSKAYSETTADAVHGEQLFQELGCVACHVTTPTPDVPDANPADRSPVPAAGNWKHWKLLGLAEFLRNPLTSRPHGRMPQFPLNEQESVDLASYCLQLSTGSKEGPGTIQPADATTEEDVATLDAAQRESRLTSVWSNALKMKGSVPGATYSERLAHVALRSMVQLQCVHCHALNGHNRLAIVRDATGLTATFSDGAQPARVPVAAIRWRGGGSDMPARGCLSADDRNSPRFSLSDRERQDLMTYVSQSGKDATPSSHSRLQVELASKNCLRCHKNEGHGGAGLAHWGGETNHHLPPDLSRVAERVRLERLTEWVTQGAGTRAMRSYVRAKMPAYGREAKRLANLLVDRDGVGQALQNGQQSYTEQIPTINNPEVNPALVRLGQFLVGSKALACANCHALHGK
ncbi:MAG: hypothetical protein O3C60_17430, partial [Planctomycetota bacterium]|nr:hypothetical protein [Planctomycetota bacterium]